MDKQNFNLNTGRLLKRLEALAQLGATPESGVCRLALTDEDKLGRDQLVSWMKQLQLRVEVDQIGNIFGIRPGKFDCAPVMTGSHIDTVFNGGKLDGSLGVLAGLEIAHTLNQLTIETDRPFVVAAFTNEEGARFQPDMLGSLIHAGGIDLATALTLEDSDGAGSEKNWNGSDTPVKWPVARSGLMPLSSCI